MKYFILSILFTIGFATAQAQEVYNSTGRSLGDKRPYVKEKDGFDASKLIFGGGFILGGGSGYFNGGISPILGYRLSDRFSAGIGVGYQYLKIKNAFSYYNAQGETVYYTVNTSIYNANVWARYIVWNNIFVHVQPEINSLDTYQPELVNTSYPAYYRVGAKRVQVASLLAGLGIRQPITDRLSFVGIVLYDVLQEQHAPYSNNIDLRFGVNVGF